MSLGIGVFLALLASGSGPFVAEAANGSLELVGTIGPTEGVRPWYVEIVRGLESDSDQLLLSVMNRGARCGGGTGVSIWKAIVDGPGGPLLSLEHKQQLGAIQMVRSDLFESSSGTLFTGSGWCGYKPPYYSEDLGETWMRADAGSVHPPNSTFTYTEFLGEVYAGTGYSPSRGEVYRWLGNGNWERVLSLHPSTNIIDALHSDGSTLFVGSIAYVSSPSQCAGTVPAYVSSDGRAFRPTSGIPSCESIATFLELGDDLMAVAYYRFTSPPRKTFYRWRAELDAWEEAGTWDFEFFGNWKVGLVAHRGSLFALGRPAAGTEIGVYRSEDLGQTWEQLAVVEKPQGFALAEHRGFLWVGTDADATGNAHLYRLSLMLEVAIDIRPGSRRNPINPLSRGVIPVALLTTGAGAREDFDAWDVDPLTIRFGPAGAPIVHAQGHAMDVDGDGDLDRILHFRTQQTGIRCGDTEATLTGTTFDGQAIQGVDAIRTVNCRARSNRGAARGPRGVHRKGKPGPRVEN